MKVIWQHGWTDTYWIGPEGWLSAELDTGGGGGDIGRGLLFHTKDGGASWIKINIEKFNSGRGTFPWGKGGTYLYSWQDIGPIHTVKAYSRHLGGGNRRVEIWLAAISGIYTSNDDGETWQRSTPRPDDRRQSEIYAEFHDIDQADLFKEVYATGWQGIAFWSSSTNRWTLELPAYSYPIAAINVFHSGVPKPDVWATGTSFVYHLKQPERVWERIVVTGIQFAPGADLLDIKVIDFQTGFAVGKNGVIVKGSKNKDGEWAWVGFQSPTKEDLNSIEYDFENDILWIVGNKGVVLSSRDRGKTWTLFVLRDQSGRLPHLKRIRYFGSDSFWIVGDFVVYKNTRSLVEN